MAKNAAYGPSFETIQYGVLTEPMGFEIGPYAAAAVKASMAGLVCIGVFGCAQTVSYAPSPITATYRLPSLFAFWETTRLCKSPRDERYYRHDYSD
jgi:hypothetical protein